MSTRCQIGFYKTKYEPITEWSALIYRHSDGYPDGVLPDIQPFLEKWAKGRGLADVEYISARLLQYLCNEYDCDMRVHEEKNKKEWEAQGKEYPEHCRFSGKLGHGICKDFHGDIEYFYRIHPDVIEVYEVGDIWDKFDSNEFKIIQTIELKKESE